MEKGAGRKGCGDTGVVYVPKQEDMFSSLPVHEGGSWLHTFAPPTMNIPSTAVEASSYLPTCAGAISAEVWVGTRSNCFGAPYPPVAVREEC